MTLKTCTRKGCGSQYVEKENDNRACYYHAGSPVFHEGLKGWSCCNKRVVDFEDFLKIPGCTRGAHTDVEDIAEQKNVTIDNSKNNTTVKPSAFKPTMESIETLPSGPAKQENVAFPIIDTEKDLLDPPDSIISVGAVCQRKGCGKAYIGDESRQECCFYHSGAPIFHEGSKGWTCCKRRVLEFDEFLKIKGCTESKHRFIQVKKPEIASSTLRYRHDWYQTQRCVTLDVFVRNADQHASQIVYSPKSVHLSLQTTKGEQCEKLLVLSHEIIPNECKHTYLGAKVEIILQKASPTMWSDLEASV